MRKIAAALAVVTGAFILTNASPAHAWPSGCTAWKNIDTNEAKAKCTGGTGHVRALAYCTANPKTGLGGYVYGPWVTPKKYTSVAECPSTGAKYIVAAGYERANW
ncbi:hypothetical protein [Nonomuraea roseola]|uniref:Uncharacterized protein n=1 Tax=Nonomuraea roseola TaxID=46179 RepID=A0ABV5Q0E6_9ACTN